MYEFKPKRVGMDKITKKYLMVIAIIVSVLLLVALSIFLYYKASELNIRL